LSRSPDPSQRPGDADLWRDLAAASLAQADAIASGDADRLDALLDEKERLLAALAAAGDAPPTDKVPLDPGLLAFAREAQAHEQAAETALRAAQAALAEKLSALRAQQHARNAFASGGRRRPAAAPPEPRFFDRKG